MLRKPLGVACAACFKHSAGVYAECGAFVLSAVLCDKLVKRSECMYLKKFCFAGTTSDKNGRRMFRSGGPGSNIPSGLSSRRAVPTLSGTNSNRHLRLTPKIAVFFARGWWRMTACT